MRTMIALGLAALLISGCAGANTIDYEEIVLSKKAYGTPDRLREKPASGWTVVMITVVNAMGDSAIKYDLAIQGENTSIEFWKNAEITRGIEVEGEVIAPDDLNPEELTDACSRTMMARLPAGQYEFACESETFALEEQIELTHPVCAVMVVISTDGIAAAGIYPKE